MNKLSRHRFVLGLLGALAAVSCAVAADGATPVGVLGLSANASVDVAQDLLSITFSTTREGSDANAIQAQLKQALSSSSPLSVEPGKTTATATVNGTVQMK